MRLTLAALVLALSLPFAAACDDTASVPEENFDNLPDCVDGHPSLGERRAITHCLIDFPDIHPVFATEDECVAWVALQGSGYPDSRDQACADYFEETGR